MKKVLFGILSFLFCFNAVYAHVEDVQFVGGTGGSKILELNVEDNKVDTSGVIYDRNASLVYEITYTNVSDLDKKINEVILPSSDILLSYDISELEKEKVIKPGETVKFQYSIKALNDVTEEQLLNLNENAQAKLVLSSVEVVNPDTKDIVIILLLALVTSIVIFKFVKDKRVFYSCFIICLVSVIFSYSKNVVADDVEVVDLDTNVKFIFSNLAPSCANLDYEGNFCIDWKQYGNRDKVNYLVMTDTKEMTDTYKIEDVNFTLENTYDVSEQQNGDVVLGVYKAQVEEESYLLLVGQDGGVIVPKDASYQFTSYDFDNNKSEYDFHFVKYLDLSDMYTNKTTNMEYMLVGIGAKADMTHYDLSGFETSNVTNMRGMFIGFGSKTKNLEIDILHFDTSNVNDMSYMFVEVGYESESVTLDLSNFDTGNVTTMKYMFGTFGAYASSVSLDIYDFDTSNVTDMSYMFSRFATYEDDLIMDYFKNWDTSKVTTMEKMFAFSLIEILKDRIEYIKKNSSVIDLTGLDFDSLEVMSGLFFGNYKVKEIIGLENINTSKVEDFYGVFSFIGLFGDKYSKLDLSNWDFSNGNSAWSMFLDANVNTVILNWSSEKKSSFNFMFNGASVNEIVLSNSSDNQSFEYLNGFFADFSFTGTLDLSDFNFITSNNYNKMFAHSDEIADYPSVFDLSGSDWNEEADVTDMFKNIKGSTIYVKDEKAKAFIEKQAPDCIVLIKE